MAFDVIGPMIRAFSGGPKPVSFRLPYDTRVEGQLDKSFGQSDAFRDLNTADLAKYSALLEQAQPEMTNTAKSGASLLKAVAERQAGASPLDDALRYSSSQLGQLKDFLPSVLNYGGAMDKLAAARSNLGDRADASSYFNILKNDRMGRNIAPLLQQIFGGAGRDTTALDSARMNQIAQLPWLSGSAINLLQQPAAASLLPIQARNNQENQGASLLAALRAISKSNAAEGTRLKKSTLDKWADFGTAADSGIGQVISLISSLYGGGGAGSLLSQFGQSGNAPDNFGSLGKSGQNDYMNSWIRGQMVPAGQVYE